MRIRRFMLKGLMVLGAASIGSVGIATAASAATGNPAPAPAASYTTQHHPGSHWLHYGDTGGKLDCKACQGQVDPHQRKITGYQITLAFTANHGKINPADKSVSVTDKYGHKATLPRVGNSATFSGEVRFQPSAYSGLSVTRGTHIAVKETCTPYVLVSGAVKCPTCTPFKYGKTYYSLTLQFTLTGGKIAPHQNYVLVQNGPHYGMLKRTATGTYAGKVNFMPNTYWLSISNGTSKVAVKATYKLHSYKAA